MGMEHDTFSIENVSRENEGVGCERGLQGSTQIYIYSRSLLRDIPRSGRTTRGYDECGLRGSCQ